MLARIVTGADGVVADLVGRPGTGAPLAAVGGLCLPHRVLHEAAELERRAARRILLVAVVAFDDLDVGPHAGAVEECRGPRHEVHRHVHRQAHRRRLKDGDFLGGRLDRCLVGGLEPGGRHDQRHLPGNTGRGDRRHGPREGEVDDDIGRAGPAIADSHPGGRHPGERPGVAAGQRMTGPIDRRHELPLLQLRRRAGDDPLPHASRGAMHHQPERLPRGRGRGRDRGGKRAHRAFLFGVLVVRGLGPDSPPS